MINEANEPSSACRFWRIYQVETSTPPSAEQPHSRLIPSLGQGLHYRCQNLVPDTVNEQWTLFTPASKRNKLCTHFTPIFNRSGEYFRNRKTTSHGMSIADFFV
jgi:hypothetical protein